MNITLSRIKFELCMENRGGAVRLPIMIVSTHSAERSVVETIAEDHEGEA